jgi:hypothetical protein
MQLFKPTRAGRRAATVLAIGVAAAVVPATAASAEPAGCSSAVSGSTSSIGLLQATATGSCSGSATRTLRVEIKHDLNLQPDALVAANSQTATTTSYRVSVSSCDHGNRGYYYGRGFFTTNSTYHDTAHTLQTTCN